MRKHSTTPSKHLNSLQTCCEFQKPALCSALDTSTFFGTFARSKPSHRVLTDQIHRVDFSIEKHRIHNDERTNREPTIDSGTQKKCRYSGGQDNRKTRCKVFQDDIRILDNNSYQQSTKGIVQNRQPDRTGVPMEKICGDREIWTISIQTHKADDNRVDCQLEIACPQGDGGAFQQFLKVNPSEPRHQTCHQD